MLLRTITTVLFPKISFTLLTLLLMAMPAFSEVLTLSGGLRLVTEQSRLIRIAEQEEAMAEADTFISRARMLPSVNASVSHSFQTFQPKAIFGPQIVPVSERYFLSYNLMLQQTLYDFRGNASRHEASMLFLDSRKLDTMRTRNIAAIEFVMAYFDVLEAEKMLSVAQKEVGRLEAHRRDARVLYEEGMITKNDLLQVEVKISDARQRLLTAEQLREITATRLNSVLARPLRTEVQVEEVSGKEFVPPEMDQEKAWEAAERQRLEIQAMDAILGSIDWEIRSKEAEYYPKFFFRGGYEYIENKYMLDEGNWIATVGLSINLFNGGSTKAEIDRIEGRRQKALRERERLLDEIRLEVQRALLEARTAREKIVVSSASVQQAEENLRINRVRYEEGTGTATEVLDAISLLTVAETNHFRSIYDLRKAEAAVLYATGKQLTEVYR